MFIPVLMAGSILSIAGCTGGSRPRETVDPDVVRQRISNALPEKLANRAAWSGDLFTAFESLGIEPDTDNICAAVAVAQQESGLQADPAVPGLPNIARKEIETRAASHSIPRLVVQAALEIRSPTGQTYNERLGKARTERELSEIFEDFIRMVPLGERLFADLNPVHTGGPMQVSIAFAEAHARAKRYPYPQTENIRREVFTRRGGLYFGIAHLLDYPAPYEAMLYRFADYNAGHYSSRNAAFQNAVSIASGGKLALDGDLLLHGARASEPSNTEKAVRKLGDELDLSEGQIRADLEKGEGDGFERTRVYSRVFALADKTRGRAVPRALVPTIKLESPKITRKLTTDWFARRVNDRYQACLARVSARGAKLTTAQPAKTTLFAGDVVGEVSKKSSGDDFFQ